MDDQHYRRSVIPHPSGGYQLHAKVLDASSAEERHPSNWVYSLGDGEFPRHLRGCD